MKRNFIRVTTMVVAVAMLLSICISAIGESETFVNDEVFSSDCESQNIYSEMFGSLSPEAKELFIYMIENNSELTRLHREYVDPEFETEDVCVQTVASTDILSNLQYELQLLSLPADVLYALDAVAASAVAAIADGILPIGEILTAFAIANAIKVVADNWTEISSKWSDIVKAFRTSLSDVSSSVDDEFTDVKESVETVQKCIHVSVDINNTRVRIDNSTYVCTTSAADLTKENAKKNLYFVAILSFNEREVLIDLDNPIDGATANAIVAANLTNVGVFCATEGAAKKIAGMNPTYHHAHNDGWNYYQHYHRKVFPKCHIWFPNIPLYT